MDTDFKYKYCRYFCKYYYKECKEISNKLNGYCDEHQKYSDNIDFFNKLYSDFHTQIIKDKIEKVINEHDIYNFEQIESLFNYISCNKRILIDCRQLQITIKKKLIEFINDCKYKKTKLKIINYLKKIFPFNKLHPNLSYKKIKINTISEKELTIFI